MKTRKEVAEYINSSQMISDAHDACPKKYEWHIGKQELKVLLDFIYEGEPEEDELIINLD